jgi:hypothetical protein
MASSGTSLRLMVEHWLEPACAKKVRVTRFRNSHYVGECYVCVERFNENDGQVAMFFFRHGDGVWRVYPQERERPSLRLV